MSLIASSLTEKYRRRIWPLLRRHVLVPFFECWPRSLSRFGLYCIICFGVFFHMLPCLNGPYVYLCSYVIFCTELSVSFLDLHSCYGAVSCSLIAESDWRRNGFPSGREIPKRVLCRVTPPVVVRICKNRAWTTFFLCRAENQPWRCMLYLDFRWGAVMRCHPD